MVFYWQRGSELRPQFIDDNYISKLLSNNPVSSTRNEEHVVLEPCMVGERVCITRPKRVSNEYFYFYSGVIKDFKVRIPFTNFEFGLLKTLNIAPSQLHLNGWGFIKVFELVCDAVDINRTLGWFFFILWVKGSRKRRLGVPQRDSDKKFPSSLYH